MFVEECNLPKNANGKFTLAIHELIIVRTACDVALFKSGGTTKTGTNRLEDKTSAQSLLQGNKNFIPHGNHFINIVFGTNRGYGEIQLLL
jgi:hypothetical protein